MKTVYSTEFKLFALDRRREGKGWGEIRRLIRDKFNPDPLPSRRAMQRWDKLDYEELSGKLTNKVQKQTKKDKDSVFIEATEAQLHSLWRLRRLDESIEYGGWQQLFTLLERILGTEKFLRYIDAYLSDRKRRPDFPPSLDD
jgi:hypothetical protein